MPKVFRAAVLAAVFVGSASGVSARQYDEDVIYGMGLAELLGTNVEVTLGRYTAREAPSIVTVITAEEIAGSGARDLIDVLRLVPGFSFGVDVNGVTDVGVRGNWGHEGKVLVLLDGMPMNEVIYGTNAFGFHYPVDQIEQIEIIRGPGSAVYGGWAELAVISIKTKPARSLDGFAATGIAGATDKTVSRYGGAFSFGKTAQDLAVVAHLWTGHALRSDRVYTSYYGASYDFTDNAALDPYMLNLGIDYRDLSLRVLDDAYHTTQRDYWGAALAYPLRADFDTRILDLKYDWKIGDRLTVTPRFTRKEGAAWRRTGKGAERIPVEGYPAPADVRFDTCFRRYTEEATAHYTASDAVDLLAGLQAYQEKVEYISDKDDGADPVSPQLGGGHFLRFHNYAAFAQAAIDTTLGTLTLGGRYEDHSQVGSSFVPRAGLTKVFDRFHFKALYAQAFKAPGADTINLNPDIDPETSEFYEVEAGCRLTDDMFLTANAYDITINDTIVYVTDPVETQLNAGKTGTRGVEFEYRYLKGWGFVNLGYSYSMATETVDYYRVPGNDDIMLGMPAHKATLNSQYRLGRFTLAPSVVWYSERYGFVREGDPVRRFDPVLLANFFVTWHPTGSLSVGAGVYDILDEAPVFIQPYDGGHSPIPGPSREYVAKVSYSVRY